MRLGKLPPVPHPAAPPLMRLIGRRPVTPSRVDWTGKLTGSPMFCNDQLGCCTIATIGHILRVWTSQLWGQELDLPDDLIRSTYFGLTGGADAGLVETRVLEMWASRGIALPQRQYTSLLTGWCTLDHRNLVHIESSIAWFGAAFLGLALPLAVQSAPAWDCVPGDDPATAIGSWGGHAVPAVAYDIAGVTVLSWGQPIKVSWPFLQAYLDEAHGPISRTWLGTSGYAPMGLDLTHLEACMAQIAQPGAPGLGA